MQRLGFAFYTPPSNTLSSQEDGHIVSGNLTSTLLLGGGTLIFNMKSRNSNTFIRSDRLGSINRPTKPRIRIYRQLVYVEGGPQITGRPLATRTIIAPLAIKSETGAREKSGSPVRVAVVPAPVMYRNFAPASTATCALIPTINYRNPAGNHRRHPGKLKLASNEEREGTYYI